MKRFLVWVTAVIILSVLVVFGVRIVSHSSSSNANLQAVPQVAATVTEGGQPSHLVAALGATPAPMLQPVDTLSTGQPNRSTYSYALGMDELPTC